MKTPISPKVTASVLAGLFASIILANITLITPDLFAGLGKWAGLADGLTIAVVTAVAGYLKTDPLRVTPPPPGSITDVAVVEASKQASLAATAFNAPATVFPTAKVDAALAADPAPVTPILPTTP